VRRDFVNPAEAAEVIEREPAGDSGPVVLPFLAERVREARESTKAHAGAEVGPFDNRNEDALRIRLPHDRASLR
jgi:hypothetical protein